MKKIDQTNYEKIAVLVPANNEEKVISICLDAVLKMTSAQHVYVVDDGSKDNTGKIARKYTRNVVRTPNRGKAHALNFGIKNYNLTKKYNYILFMDADTKPSSSYLNFALRHFKNDKEKKIHCVIGRVKVSGNNWISKYRQWEYQISYLIHKKAQEYMKSILVAPGCATLYRSEVFKTLKFPSGTLTEDMDFTFQMHRNGLNYMVFDNKAIVYTIDPQNLKDFVKQLNRWYTGFWQVVRKHDVPWRGQVLDFEVAMLAVEGLYSGFLVILFAISIIKFLFFGGFGVFIYPFLFDLIIFFIPSMLWSMWSDKDYTRIFYIFHFYFLRFLSSLIFLKSFFSGFISLEKEYVWNSNRELRKEGLKWRFLARN